MAAPSERATRRQVRQQAARRRAQAQLRQVSQCPPTEAMGSRSRRVAVLPMARNLGHKMRVCHARRTTTASANSTAMAAM